MGAVAMMVYSEEISHSSVTQPSNSLIQRALEAIYEDGARPPHQGRFLGLPRITRVNFSVGLLGQFVTRVCWVYMWRNAVDDSAIKRWLYNAIPTALSLVGNWSKTAILPYKTEVNGPVEWWASNQASEVSLLQDLFAPVSAPNPIGPSSNLPGWSFNSVSNRVSDAIIRAVQNSFGGVLTSLPKVGEAFSTAAILVGSALLLLAWNTTQRSGRYA